MRYKQNWYGWKFTQQIQYWLNTKPEERDYSVGALYLLKLSGNQIMYCNLVATDPAAKAEFIEYQLNKYLGFRLQRLTHTEGVQMAAQVETIVA